MTNLSLRTGLNTSCKQPLPGCPATAYNSSWFLDVPALMTLNAAAADAYTVSMLAAWDPVVPPCSGSIAVPGTGVNGTGTCSYCGNASLCGTLRAVDGALLCNWPFIECKQKRVVAILGGKVRPWLYDYAQVYKLSPSALALPRDCSCDGTMLISAVLV